MIEARVLLHSSVCNVYLFQRHLLKRLTFPLLDYLFMVIKHWLTVKIVSGLFMLLLSSLYTCASTTFFRLFKFCSKFWTWWEWIQWLALFKRSFPCIFYESFDDQSVHLSKKSIWTLMVIILNMQVNLHCCLNQTTPHFCVYWFQWHLLSFISLWIFTNVGKSYAALLKNG